MNLYTNLVEAGEAGGILDVIFTRLSNYIEKLKNLKKKVKGALVYPAVVVGVAIFVMAIILIFVIPVFEKMFPEVGQALPLPTQVVIELSRFVKKNIIFLIVGFGLDLSCSENFTGPRPENTWWTISPCACRSSGPCCVKWP